MTPHESGFSVQNAGLKAVIPAAEHVGVHRQGPSRVRNPSQMEFDLQSTHRIRIRVANVENESPPVHTNTTTQGKISVPAQRGIVRQCALRTFKPGHLDHGRSERAVGRSRVEPILAYDVRVELGDCDHRGKII